MPAAEELVRDLPEARRAKPSVVARGAAISAAIAQLLAHPEGRIVHVVDDGGRPVGTVSYRDILRVTNARYGARPAGVASYLRQVRDLMHERVDDIMRPPTPVREDTPLREALALLESTRQNDLPIVDAAGRLVGELNALQVLERAHRLFQETESALARARAEERA